MDRKLLNKLLANEGVLSLDNDDRGGLTLFGVAYNMHPKRLDWTKIINKIISVYKKHGVRVTDIELRNLGKKRGKPIPQKKLAIQELNKYFESDTKLNNQIYKFYKARFWDKINGDNLISKSFAESLFDFNVNTGFRGRKLFQEKLKISADGIYGSGTAKSINKKLITDALELHVLLFCTKITRYVQIMESKNNKKYIYGWCRRSYNCLLEEIQIGTYLRVSAEFGKLKPTEIFLRDVKEALFLYKKQRNLSLLMKDLKRIEGELRW